VIASGNSLACDLRAGVSAYVVDELDPKRIATIIDVAVAQFEDVQRLRGELAEANRKLNERRLVERAKGLLMKSRRLDEEAAYRCCGNSRWIGS